MGDYMQTLVDVEIDKHAAVKMKQRLTTWLIDRGIIAPELTDCVMSGSDSGYAPGAEYGRAVGDASADLPAFAVNGVEIDAGRQMYWSLDLVAVMCPRCGHRESVAPPELGRWHTAFTDAINEWHRGGEGLVACLGCGARNGPNDWDWGEAPRAFSSLGLTFWNWRVLSQQFIAEVREFLGGTGWCTAHPRYEIAGNDSARSVAKQACRRTRQEHANASSAGSPASWASHPMHQ